MTSNSTPWSQNAASAPAINAELGVPPPISNAFFPGLVRVAVIGFPWLNEFSIVCRGPFSAAAIYPDGKILWDFLWKFCIAIFTVSNVKALRKHAAWRAVFPLIYRENSENLTCFIF
jgi:hypothetical protein